MQLNRLSIKDLQELINTTSDLKLLQRAQDEYVDRTCKPELLDEDEDFEWGNDE